MTAMMYVWMICGQWTFKGSDGTCIPTDMCMYVFVLSSWIVHSVTKIRCRFFFVYLHFIVWHMSVYVVWLCFFRLFDKRVYISCSCSFSLSLSLCLLAQFLSYSPPDSIRTKHAGVLYRCRCIHRKMHFCIRRDGRRARVHTFIDCHSQIFMINRRPFGGNL